MSQTEGKMTREEIEEEREAVQTLVDSSPDAPEFMLLRLRRRIYICDLALSALARDASREAWDMRCPSEDGERECEAPAFCRRHRSCGREGISIPSLASRADSAEHVAERYNANAAAPHVKGMVSWLHVLGESIEHAQTLVGTEYQIRESLRHCQRTFGKVISIAHSPKFLSHLSFHAGHSEGLEDAAKVCDARALIEDCHGSLAAEAESCAAAIRAKIKPAKEGASDD